MAKEEVLKEEAGGERRREIPKWGCEDREMAARSTIQRGFDDNEKKFQFLIYTREREQMGQRAAGPSIIGVPPGVLREGYSEIESRGSDRIIALPKWA